MPFGKSDIDIYRCLGSNLVSLPLSSGDDAEIGHLSFVNQWVAIADQAMAPMVESSLAKDAAVKGQCALKQCLTCLRMKDQISKTALKLEDQIDPMYVVTNLVN